MRRVQSATQKVNDKLFIPMFPVAIPRDRDGLYSSCFTKPPPCYTDEQAPISFKNNHQRRDSQAQPLFFSIQTVEARAPQSLNSVYQSKYTTKLKLNISPCRC
ncbi:Hypothetical_protein [Hexamita inflata]|uniref:Hypothetical_protein n=1 Tax=Hexamita inflata TaxID=28002 RepID=A0AA86U4Z3_9EUKA|nr:Hypothetical protein HINF_LOCUS25757 [Hexamita inflata]